MSETTNGSNGVADLERPATEVSAGQTEQATGGMQDFHHPAETERKAGEYMWRSDQVGAIELSLQAQKKI